MLYYSMLLNTFKVKLPIKFASLLIMIINLERQASGRRLIKEDRTTITLATDKANTTTGN